MSAPRKLLTAVGALFALTLVLFAVPAAAQTEEASATAPADRENAGVESTPTEAPPAEGAPTTTSAEARPESVTPPPSAPSGPLARLLVASNVVGATVEVDGEVRGTTPLAPLAVPVGGHEVRVSLAGYRAYERRVELTDRGSRVDATLEAEAATVANLAAEEEAALAGREMTGPTPWYERWYVWAGVGGGVVLVAIIAGAAAAAASAEPADPSGFLVPNLP